MARILSIILLYVVFTNAADMHKVFWCDGKSCEYTHQNAMTTIGDDSLTVRFSMDGKVLGIPFFGTYSKICRVEKTIDYRAYIITNEDGGKSLFMSYPDHAIYIFNWNTDLPVEPSIVDLIIQNGHYFLFSGCETAYMRYALGVVESKCPSSKK